MSLRRVRGLVLAGLGMLLCIACGQVYRPVVLPISNTPPSPSTFHAVFGLSTNIPSNLGAALQVDVSGDSVIGEAYMGVNPTHAAILPNDSRVFVASAGSLYPGDTDIITAFTPAVDATIATGLGTPTIFSFPNVGTVQTTSITSISENGAGNVTVVLSSALSQAVVGRTIEISGVNVTGVNPAGYDGTFTMTAVNGATIQYVDPVLGLPAATGGTAVIPLTCSYLPDYVATAQSTAVFVADYGVENSSNCNVTSTDSVAVLSPSTNAITQIAYLTPASHPIAMVETPDQNNLYVLNQNNTIVNLSPTSLESNLTSAPLATIPLPAGSTAPVWAVSRVDSQLVYVLTEGDGSLQTISPATNTIISTLPVGGPGANYVAYDPTLNRLYVTNPTAGNIYVFNAGTAGTASTPPTPPTLLSTISMTSGANPPCPNGCSPVSVAALPDGSRFYVASFLTASACPDPNVGAASACIIPMLTVFDAASMTVKPASSTLSNLAPSISLFGAPQFAATQYAVPLVSPDPCAPAATYTPGATRFRMFATASADSSHVYVSVCNAGVIADIATTTTTLPTGGTNTPDQFMADLLAPYSAAAAPPGGEPPLQNPIFLLTGQ
jgi:streptogramin lyase